MSVQLAFVFALEEDIVPAPAASKDPLFIKPNKSRTSLLIHIMPYSTINHSKLIRSSMLCLWLINEFSLFLSFVLIVIVHSFLNILCIVPCLILSFPRCDPGFSGPACELASQTFPAFLSEGFSSPRLSSYHTFSSLRGAEVSFGCGVLASGKALVFNRDSRRHLVTAPLDSSQAR